MGAGFKIAGGGAIIGIILIVLGVVLSLTIIGAIIGIPLILIGLGIMGWGTIIGTGVGTGSIIGKKVKEGKEKKIELRGKGLCPYCGYKISKNATFCEHCGKDIGKKYCKFCGGRLTKNSKFCKYCKMRL